MAISSTSNNDGSGNGVPLSESVYPIEEKEREKSIVTDEVDSKAESVPSSKAQPKDADDALSFSEYSCDHSQDKEISEGKTTVVVEAISPMGASDVDVTPIETDIGFDEDTNAAAHHPHRIEPEGTTPIVGINSSRRFDDGMLDAVLSDSLERPEHRERTNITRMQRIESQEDVATQQEGILEDETEAEENQAKKKRREPPGTPAKHKRKMSETASEREQRIKDDSKHSQKTSAAPGGSQVVEEEIDEGGEQDEKKGDDQRSIQREPSGTSISVSNMVGDTRDVDSSQGKQHTEITHDEQSKQFPPVEVEIGEKQYMGSPSRTSHRHVHDLNMNPDIHAKSHAFTQPYASNENLRQTPNTLSPDFFLSDNESVPIPHLPPLVVPGFATSYDSMSLQGAGHAVHLNQNGYQQQFHALPPMPAQQQQQQQQSVLPIPNQVTTIPGGKRKIHLRLFENVRSPIQPEKSIFLSFRRKKGILRRQQLQSSTITEFSDNHHSEYDGFGDGDEVRYADRGTLTVSWYEGTGSLELQEHVHNSVIRKLGLKSTAKLLDFRVLDESSDPPEEIVLSPYIPNRSRLIVRFSTTDSGGDITPPKYTRFSDYDSGPPDSPSAAPSPYPRSLDLEGLGLNANQLALLGTRLNALQVPRSEGADSSRRGKLRKLQPSKQQPQTEKKTSKDSDEEEEENSKGSNLEVASLHPEDPIQKSLREITGILLNERKGRQPYVPHQEKRQVVFVLANYFVLFLSLIAISAEIQARAPDWHAAMEQQLKNVHDCSKDKESLFTCVENGDMAGLVASVVLWVSRSAATKRIFLLGFGSSNKLWTAVYESLVTAICWGFSYMFIRRGMNPDNNRDFLRRYWKDAVYGSLAGFNAAFMKQVLKNLIPQEVIEDALQERQLKILSWLPSIG
eukprot:CAMPEP_0201136134 /NCGR_PEP_ID=MMETSP0850-20130426/54719_1 /ASSEMBLY_ACC=CAM_ASM_000622 /TAXON_ID=183588 /ORGANISM="Pseudo-nitzschia fraudulenta, Strain WWA7" /LENGTH=905 /DNA_ID=CAMNT_0047407409 /DNA_START=33 /DNA_END=2750 /DNA_ORIENTATION=-